MVNHIYRKGVQWIDGQSQKKKGLASYAGEKFIEQASFQTSRV